MKRISFFIGMLLSISNLVSQEKISKQENAIGINEINIELKFAKNIQIKNSTDNQVSIEAEVNINENKDNHYFSLKTKKTNQKLSINSDYGDLFKKNKNKQHYYCDNCTNGSQLTTNYVVYIPKNKTLKLESISGNVDITEYNGMLTLDLISGNITVKNHSKEMNLKTISGDIDVFVDDATFKAETLSGTIYSNLDIDFNNQNKNSGATNKISGLVKNGTASLTMKTISGNVFLRKI